MGHEKKRKKKVGALTAPSKVYEADRQRWEAEDDLRALARAKAVREDPERMKRACKLAAEKLEENKGKKEEAELMIKMGEGKMPMGEMET